ncbi:unnamed protein product, partial [Rotaria magnacalcarata]
MNEGLYVLRILFYANLLGGERQILEIIETERENDQRMEVELINRRQRHNDDDVGDDGNHNEQEQNQQQQQQQSAEQGENRSEAAATSPLRHRSTSFTMRTSTSEQDEIESLYENPLQIKLGLEPNE